MDVDRESLEFCRQYLMDEYGVSLEAQSADGNAKGETVHTASDGSRGLLRTRLRIIHATFLSTFSCVLEFFDRLTF